MLPIRQGTTKLHIAFIVVIFLLTPYHSYGNDSEIERVKYFNYQRDAIYPLNLKMGYQLVVEFHPDETIKTISSGNHYAWSMNVLGNRLLIKPLESNITTNAFVLTNERSYHFEVKSDSSMQQKDLDYLIKFNYDASGIATWRLPMISSFFDDESKLNYKYTYVAGDEIEPKKICDNGKNTYMYMNRSIDPYDLQVWIKKGDEVVLIPGHVEGKAIFIAGVYNSITLVIKGFRVDIHKLE